MNKLRRSRGRRRTIHNKARPSFILRPSAARTNFWRRLGQQYSKRGRRGEGEREKAGRNVRKMPGRTRRKTHTCGRSFNLDLYIKHIQAQFVRAFVVRRFEVFDLARARVFFSAKIFITLRRKDNVNLSSSYLFCLVLNLSLSAL